MADNVPSNDTPTLLGQETQPRGIIISADQIGQISNNLKEQISKSIKDMKVLSNEVISSESHDAELLEHEEDEARPDEIPKKRGKMPNTKIVGEFSLSYEIPPILIQNNIEFDKSLLCHGCVSDPTKGHKFSFIERLQNWTIRQRKRNKGEHRDVYYDHMASKKIFRSKNEVINFMIFEKYPPKPTYKKEKKVQVKEETSSAAANENEPVGGEKKQKCDDEEKIDQWAIHKERVERFLAESYNNLMNRDTVISLIK